MQVGVIIPEPVVVASLFTFHPCFNLYAKQINLNSRYREIWISCQNNIVIISCLLSEQHNEPNASRTIVRSSTKFSIIHFFPPIPYYQIASYVIFIHGERKHPHNVYEMELFTVAEKEFPAGGSFPYSGNEDLFKSSKRWKWQKLCLLLFIYLFTFFFSFFLFPFFHSSLSRRLLEIKTEGKVSSRDDLCGGMEIALWVLLQWQNFTNWSRQWERDLIFTLADRNLYPFNSSHSTVCDLFLK